MPIKDKAYHSAWWRKKRSKMTPEQIEELNRKKRAWRAGRKARGLKVNWPKKDEVKRRQSEKYYKQKYGEFWEAKMLLNLFYQEMRRDKNYEKITQIKADKKRRPTSPRLENHYQRGLRRFEELFMGDHAGGKKEGPGPDVGQCDSAAGKGDALGG